MLWARRRRGRSGVVPQFRRPTLGALFNPLLHSLRDVDPPRGSCQYRGQRHCHGPFGKGRGTFAAAVFVLTVEQHPRHVDGRGVPARLVDSRPKGDFAQLPGHFREMEPYRLDCFSFDDGGVSLPYHQPRLMGVFAPGSSSSGHNCSPQLGNFRFPAHDCDAAYSHPRHNRISSKRCSVHFKH